MQAKPSGIALSPHMLVKLLGADPQKFNAASVQHSALVSHKRPTTRRSRLQYTVQYCKGSIINNHVTAVENETSAAR